MHMTDPRVIDLTPEARKAFDGADIVVIETTEILNEVEAAKSLFAKPELTMFTDATTLTSLVKPEDKAELEAGLKKRGIPLMAVNKMKPWMIAGLLSRCRPARSTARRAARHSSTSRSPRMRRLPARNWTV